MRNIVSSLIIERNRLRYRIKNSAFYRDVLLWS
jgi:hypothetical protein